MNGTLTTKKPASIVIMPPATKPGLEGGFVNGKIGTVMPEDIVREVLGRAGVPMGPVTGGGARAPPASGFNLTSVLERPASQPENIPSAEPDAATFIRWQGISAMERVNWKGMPKDERVAYTRWFMKQNELILKRHLQKACSGLYKSLRADGLLDAVGFGKKEWKWKSKSDDELVAFAENLKNEKKLKTVTELRKANYGMFGVLDSRGLMARLTFEKPQGRLAAMDDPALVLHANTQMEEKGLKYRTHLERNVYNELRDRGLLGQVKTATKVRIWADMTKRQRLSAARKFIRDNHIERRNDFGTAMRGLCKALKKDGTFYMLRFKKEGNHWAAMDDSQLIGFALDYIRENKLTYRWELGTRFSQLYEEVRTRGLLERTGLLRKNTDWKAMSETKLLRMARAFIRDNDIKSPYKFQLFASRMYGAVSRRGLLRRLGLKYAKTDWEAMTPGQVLHHARAIMRERGITTKTDMENRASGAFRAVRDRGLLGSIRFRKREFRWASLSKRRLMHEAHAIIKKFNIANQKQLGKMFGGLYDRLENDGLLEGLLPKKTGRWAPMSDERLVRYAQRRMSREKIISRRQFVHVTGGLYDALERRGLEHRLKFRWKRISSGSLSDAEALAYASWFIGIKELTSMTALRKACTPLYGTLWRKALLSQIPLSSGGRGDWAFMSFVELKAYTRHVISTRGVRELPELADIDLKVYTAASRRGVLREIEDEGRMLDARSGSEVIGTALAASR